MACGNNRIQQGIGISTELCLKTLNIPKYHAGHKRAKQLQRLVIWVDVLHDLSFHLRTCTYTSQKLIEDVGWKLDVFRFQCFQLERSIRMIYMQVNK